jgi:cytochrome c oxidase subunit IV
MSEQGTTLKPESTGTVHDEPGGSELHAHAVPLWMLIGVFAALIVLTVVTVAVTYVDLGALNIWVALAIAAVKGVLVAEIFMHLRWDRPFNRILLVGALLAVALFIGISLLDTSTYLPDMIPGHAPAVEQP